MNSDYDCAGFEPVAIVGMGCRFAGDSFSPSKLWDMLKDGRSGQSDVPKNRFSIESWHSPAKGRPGSLYSKGGYFLSHDDSYRNFDPSFFAISPLEATSMDPQQRKLLEVVFECFESAGKSLDEMSGSETACYVGCFSTDFDHIQSKDPEYSVPYQSTGSGMTILSNRISYVFNLRGPSLTVDTACSSSLYALHLGCQALLAGDCTAAVVGGSSLIASVEKHLRSESLGILSPTSTCHTFDASADGFGRGDGVAALYIKRLSDAVANGDPIRAVIRSTAINANGKGLGINHPSQEAQEAVIRKAYARAGLDFAQTGYFECHGTGTPVGDPIECAAIGNIFTESRTVDNPILIGSVKTNIGHCEGASSLAAIIKTVLCLEKSQIPATVGVKKLNPNIDFKSGRLSVVRSLTPWPQKLNYRRASVNSFGYGGANAHVIIDATESFLREPRSLDHKIASAGSSSKKRYLLAFSAHDQVTLKNNIKALSKVVTKHKVSDISYTLGAHRTRFSHRGFSICRSSTISEELQESKITYGLSRHTDSKIVFAFTGQGAQWPQMCYALICHFPSVRRTFEQLEQSLQKLPTPPDFSIIDVLSAPKESTTIYHSVRSPVCCTAVQVALTILLESWGVRPAAVAGHSAGEISAAFAAGLITGTEAVAIAYYRGIAVLNCKENGSMLAVGLGPEEVQPFIKGQSGVVIGCYNSPQSVTLSGQAHVIEEIRVSLAQAGIFARKVNTSDNAYHSHLMASAAQKFQGLFSGIYSEMIHSPARNKRLPRIPMYSCITGELLKAEIVPFEYWRSSLELPVLFDQASQALFASHSTARYVVEIGPHSALAGPIRQITMSLGFSEERLTYLPTLVRGEDGVDNVLRLVGTLFNLGYPVDLTRVNAMDTYYGDVSDEEKCEIGKLLVDLPTYQWNYEGLLWKESRRGREFRFRKHCRHDLLGSREPGGSQNSHLWRNHLDVSFVPWLQDHKIGNDILFPAAGYIAMAIEALNQVAHDQDLLVPLQGYTIQGLNITSALIIPTEGSVETLFNMRDLSLPGQVGSKCFDFRISSVSEDGRWCEHGAGTIYLAEPYGDIKEQTSVGRRTKISSSKNWYSALSSAGITFGPSFQTVSDISLVPERNEAIASLALLTTKDIMAAESRYIIHPTSIDGCLQMSVLAAYCNTKLTSKAFIPVFIEDLTVWTPPTSERTRENAVVNAQGNLQGLRSVNGTARVFCEDGHLLVQGRVRFLSLEGGVIHSQTAIPRQLHSRLVWKPDVDRLGALYYPLDPHRDAISFVSAQENFDLLDFIDLLGHKSRSLKILQLGIGSSGPLVKDFGGDFCQSVYSQYTIASHDDTSIKEAKELFSGSSNMDFRILDIEQARSGKRIDTGGYDLVILSEAHDPGKTTIRALTNCLDLLKPNGKLWIDANICEAQTTLLTDLTTAGFAGGLVRISQSQNAVVAEPRRVLSDSSRTHETLWLVYLKIPHPLGENISKVAAKLGILTTSVSLLHVKEVIPTDSNIIMMAELEGLCLSRMNEEELTALQYLVKKVSSFIWVTNGGLLDGSQPEKSLASGLAKTLMNEQLSLRMTCFDIEPQETNFFKSAIFIIDQHLRLQNEEMSEVEMDLVQKNGLIYISRFLRDNTQNDLFQKMMNPPVVEGLFGAYSPTQLDFQLVGQIDSFYYKQKGGDGTSLTPQPNEILLEPQAYSLSVMEATILRGQQESEFFSHESASTVRACGSSIVDFQPGDRVLSLKPGKFDSSFIVKENNCHKLLPDEKIDDLVGAFVPVCTALHVLNNLGREGRRGAILVHVPGDHLLASAFIQLGRHRGLQLFTTYNSEAERCYFLDVEGVPGDLLISTNTPAWTRSFKPLTAAQEISAIIASATAHDHQELWKNLGENGSYWLLGSGRHIPKLATFDNSVFLRGSSIVSFDIINLLQKGDEYIKELIQETFKLYHGGQLATRSPTSFFDISQLQDAVSFTSTMENLHKVILRCNPNSSVPCRVTYKPSSFDPSATFLMIGCLGGLGRSITTWMVERGARHFVFLSRSGAEGPEAAALLEAFDEYSRAKGFDIRFHVVRGDVSSRNDVDKAIATAETPIKGVIHAAATFQKCLFENMTVKKFHEVLDPKVRGTMNLHEALLGEPLDFFVMTSSTLGFRGPVTQTGYAAANAFMDSMARHRWSLGMQATSLALGMVQEIGHVEAHPEIKAAMLHNSLYGINETEFLAIMELACQPHHLGSSPLPLSKYDIYSNSLIVTGMESPINSTLQRTWLQDKRFQHLGHEKPAPATTSTFQNSGTLDILLNAFNDGGDFAVKNAVKEIVLKWVSKLFLVPVEKLRESMSKPLASFGLDSMVSSEVRALAWSNFKADIPLMKILESGLLFQELLDLIWENMDSGLKSGNALA